MGSVRFQGNAMSTRSPADPAPKVPAEPTDNPLESLGKAIADPVESAAEDEEPKDRRPPPVRPGG